MKAFPIAVINNFKSLYTRSEAILIPYRGGEESSDGILYRFQDETQNRLLKVMFLGKQNVRKALLRLEARLQFIDYLFHQEIRVTELLPSLSGQLFEKIEDEKGTWVAYAMKRIFGKTISYKV